MLFPALREWSMFALLVSLIPLIGGLLLARHLFFSSRSLWLTPLFLIPLGLFIWSGVAAINAYSLDWQLGTGAPHHGITQYIIREEKLSAYTQTIFISQLQIVLALLVILLLVVIWFITKRTAGEPARNEARRSMRQRLL